MKRVSALVPVKYSHYGNGGRPGFLMRFQKRYTRAPTKEEDEYVGSNQGGWIGKVEKFWASRNETHEEAAVRDDAGNLEKASHMWRKNMRSGLSVRAADRKVLLAIRFWKVVDDNFVHNHMLSRLTDYTSGRLNRRCVNSAVPNSRAGPPGTFPGALHGAGPLAPVLGPQWYAAPEDEDTWKAKLLAMTLGTMRTEPKMIKLLKGKTMRMGRAMRTGLVMTGLKTGVNLTLF